MFTRQGNPRGCNVTLYVGEELERDQCCLLHSLPVFSHFPCYPQAKWTPLVLIPKWGACACSRPLWVSPTNSPVRLGVSPAAASTPTAVFSQRFEALFPHAGALGCGSVTPSTSCCLAGSASGRLTLSPLRPAARLHSSYRLGKCFFFFSLVVGLPHGSIFCQFCLVFVF